MKFVRGTLTEPDGKPSFSRLFSAIVILSPIGWITFLVIHNHALPELGGLTLFMSTILAIILGINKAPAIIESVKAAPTTNGKPAEPLP